MSMLVESTERSGVDNLHFGLVFVGFILSAAGVALVCPAVLIVGVLLTAVGLGYFLLLNV
jgi:hypothetical protein